MKFEYYPETDTLYISLLSNPSQDASEVAPDVMLDFDADGNVVGMTIEHASKRADLSSLSVTKIPALAA